MDKAGSSWGDRKSLLAQLEKYWGKGLLLQAQFNDTGLFPKRLNFKTPSSQALTEEFDAVRRWVADIQKLSGFRVVTKTVRHRIIGENSLPCEVWIDSLDTAIELLHKRKPTVLFCELVSQTQQHTPELIDWVMQQPLKTLSLAKVWPKLLDFVRWRQQHPDPNIYLRQVSLPGIDSKFIEQHRATLAPLLDLALSPNQIKNNITGVKQFDRRYGFYSKPERVRFRLLGSDSGADNDITLTATDFKQLPQRFGFDQSSLRVFITENEINFLAFPPQQNSLVIFGSGYGFEALAQADWLQEANIFYWGDIDTHGFAILDQLRGKFPLVKSLLMDETTLLHHRQFWGQEDKPETRELSRLTADEQLLYQALLSHQYQDHLRLEQERVYFDYINMALSQLEPKFEQ